MDVEHLCNCECVVLLHLHILVHIEYVRIVNSSSAVDSCVDVVFPFDDESMGDVSYYYLFIHVYAGF